MSKERIDDSRPLREVFPTANGHRLQKCPACGNPTPRGPDGTHTCRNAEGHARADWEFYRDAKVLTW